MTMRSPREIAARASRMPGSNETGSAQSTTVAMPVMVPGVPSAPTPPPRLGTRSAAAGRCRPVAAGQVLVGRRVAPRVRGQERAYLGALVLAVLHDEQAARMQQPRRRRHDGPHRIEAVGA